MAHHFACPDKNFGISHRWVDRLLGSLRVRGQGAAHEPAAAPGADSGAEG
jgi:dihydroceramide fatty acyl 2-hydroxylase